jgi:hypothetical protein
MDLVDGLKGEGYTWCKSKIMVFLLGPAWWAFVCLLGPAWWAFVCLLGPAWGAFVCLLGLLGGHLSVYWALLGGHLSVYLALLGGAFVCLLGSAWGDFFCLLSPAGWEGICLFQQQILFLYVFHRNLRFMYYTILEVHLVVSNYFERYFGSVLRY